MAEIFAQLGIDQTFYMQFAIFVALFLVLPPLFFKPFQKLIEARHQKTVADRERAEELVKQANAKLDEFRTRMTEERARARAEHERVISEVKAEEAKIVGVAREEAKKITQMSLENIQNQSAQLKRALEADVEGLALQISDMLTKR
ncbi:MAG: ATP synthase F0 subunit B [Bdellovibrionales bacterium]|nr:ATP synthase F0 subunit B [Bdellovibrionales bacterium]